MVLLPVTQATGLRRVIHLRRNNRSILLLGTALALLTFVVVLVIGNAAGPGSGAGATAAPGTIAVVATVDVPLGTVVTADMVKNQVVTVASRDTTAYGDVSLVIGKTARRGIFAGAQILQADFGVGGAVTVGVPKGLRGFAISVDELSGVGNIIRAGDFVDVVITLSEDAIPVAVTQVGVPDWQLQSGYKPLTVKVPLLLQNIQVLGTIDAVSRATTSGGGGSIGTGGGKATPAPVATPAPALTGLPKLIILAVTAAQAEALVFARTTGKIDLILRGAGDAETVATDGVVLRSLFDRYGVLPPYVLKTLDVFIPR